MNPWSPPNWCQSESSCYLGQSLILSYLVLWVILGHVCCSPAFEDRQHSPVSSVLMLWILFATCLVFPCIWRLTTFSRLIFFGMVEILRDIFLIPHAFEDSWHSLVTSFLELRILSGTNVLTVVSYCLVYWAWSHLFLYWDDIGDMLLVDLGIKFR